jgi:hypothetical protein
MMFQLVLHAFVTFTIHTYLQYVGTRFLFIPVMYYFCSFVYDFVFLLIQKDLSILFRKISSTYIFAPRFFFFGLQMNIFFGPSCIVICSFIKEDLFQELFKISPTNIFVLVYLFCSMLFLFMFLLFQKIVPHYVIVCAPLYNCSHIYSFFSFHLERFVHFIS